VRVRVGGHPIDPAVIEQGFHLAAFGTVAAEATVAVTFEPLLLHCMKCGTTSPVTDGLDMVACRSCGAIDVETIGDERLVLESISLRASEGGPNQ